MKTAFEILVVLFVGIIAYLAWIIGGIITTFILAIFGFIGAFKPIIFGLGLLLLELCSIITGRNK